MQFVDRDGELLPIHVDDVLRLPSVGTVAACVSAHLRPGLRCYKLLYVADIDAPEGAVQPCLKCIAPERRAAIPVGSLREVTHWAALVDAYHKMMAQERMKCGARGRSAAHGGDGGTARSAGAGISSDGAPAAQITLVALTMEADPTMRVASEIGVLEEAGSDGACQFSSVQLRWQSERREHSGALNVQGDEVPLSKAYALERTCDSSEFSLPGVVPLNEEVSGSFVGTPVRGLAKPVARPSYCPQSDRGAAMQRIGADSGQAGGFGLSQFPSASSFCGATSAQTSQATFRPSSSQWRLAAPSPTQSMTHMVDVGSFASRQSPLLPPECAKGLRTVGSSRTPPKTSPVSPAQHSAPRQRCRAHPPLPKAAISLALAIHNFGVAPIRFQMEHFIAYKVELIQLALESAYPALGVYTWYAYTWMGGAAALVHTDLDTAAPAPIDEAQCPGRGVPRSYHSNGTEASRSRCFRAFFHLYMRERRVPTQERMKAFLAALRSQDSTSVSEPAQPQALPGHPPMTALPTLMWEDSSKCPTNVPDGHGDALGVHLPSSAEPKAWTSHTRGRTARYGATADFIFSPLTIEEANRYYKFALWMGDHAGSLDMAATGNTLVTLGNVALVPLKEFPRHRLGRVVELTKQCGRSEREVKTALRGAHDVMPLAVLALSSAVEEEAETARRTIQQTLDSMMWFVPVEEAVRRREAQPETILKIVEAIDDDPGSILTMWYSSDVAVRDGMRVLCRALTLATGSVVL